MNNENELESNLEENQYKYISVIFENKYHPFDDARIREDISFRREIYGNSQQYTYKTDKNFKKGQILNITSQSGSSKVLVINPNILKESIRFPLNKIKELELEEL